jgi:hypothetical protein
MLLFIPLLINNLKKIEKYENKINYGPIKTMYLYMLGYSPDLYYKWTITDNIILAFLYIITFIISIGAAYLSYSCTWSDTFKNPFLRVVFAFIAFMLGPVYLVWYLLVNYLGGLC